MLPNGIADLSAYNVENCYDNRILLADFIPEGLDQEEEDADAFLMLKWQEHINATIDAGLNEAEDEVNEHLTSNQDSSDPVRESKTASELLLEEHHYIPEVPDGAVAGDEDAFMATNLAEFAEINCEIGQLRRELTANKILPPEEPAQDRSDVKNPFACYESICNESAPSKLQVTPEGGQDGDEEEEDECTQNVTAGFACNQEEQQPTSPLKMP